MNAIFVVVELASFFEEHSKPAKIFKKHICTITHSVESFFVSSKSVFEQFCYQI